MKSKQFIPTLRGKDAILAARSSATLYVHNAQHGWLRGDAAMLVRAERMLAADGGVWVYGA